jgi:hypothetical protein
MNFYHLHQNIARLNFEFAVGFFQEQLIIYLMINSINIGFTVQIIAFFLIFHYLYVCLFYFMWFFYSFFALAIRFHMMNLMIHFLKI